MFEYLDIINNWQDHTKIFLARVIKTWGSAPRRVGAMMFINGVGNMAGSVSGGCIEADVVKFMLNNKESKLLKFGVSDEDAWSAGLSCGGSVEVYVQPVDFKNIVWKSLIQFQTENVESILVSSLENQMNTNSLITEDGQVIGEKLDDVIIEEALKGYRHRKHSIIHHVSKDYFLQIFPRKSQLIIIGAAHITNHLVDFGNQFGFETIVIDPRGYFSDNVIFNNKPSQIIQNYPSEVLHQFPLDAYTYCAVLSHDPKIDDDALKILLSTDVAYIGVLGSKNTHAKRIKRLLDCGIDTALLDKIDAPIGVDINAKSAKEIALSVISQIIAIKNKYI